MRPAGQLVLPQVVLPYKADTPVAASRRLLLALWEHPHGLETTAEATHRLDNADKANCLSRRILAQCIYDIGKNTAHFGSAKIDGPALMWTLIDGTPLGGKTLNRTPSDRALPDGRMLDKTPPDGRALNKTKLDSSLPAGRAPDRTPPARSADSVKPRANPAGSTADAHQASPQTESASDGGAGIPSQARGARHENPQADLASAISLNTADRGTSMRSPGISPALVGEISLDSADTWVMRCDRVDFSPAVVAHPHTHPGPGIRRLLFGELTVTTAGATSTYRRGGAWFESGPDVVYAEASLTEETAFVRVMLLPSEWAGKRTISYVDTAATTDDTTDDTTAGTKGRQRATILGEAMLDPLAKT